MSIVKNNRNDDQPTLEKLRLEINQQSSCLEEERQRLKNGQARRKKLRDVPDFVAAGEAVGVKKPVASLKDLFTIEVGTEEELGKIEEASDRFQRFRDKGIAIYNWMVNQALHFLLRMEQKVREQKEIFLVGIYDLKTGQTNREAIKEVETAMETALQYGPDNDDELQQMLQQAETEEAEQRVKEFTLLLARFVSENARLGQVIFDLSQAMDKPELLGILNQLVEDKVIKCNPQGVIKTFSRQGFSLAKDAFGPVSSEAEELIAEVVAKRTRQLATDYATASEQKRQELSCQSEISAFLLWKDSDEIEDKECFLALPGKDENDNRNGLLVAKSGKTLVVVDACGAPASNFTELRKVCEKHKLLPLVFWGNLRSQGRLVPPDHRFNIRIPDKIQDADERKTFYDNSVYLTRWVRDALEHNLPEEFHPAARKSQPQQDGDPDKELTPHEFHHIRCLGQYEILMKKWTHNFTNSQTHQFTDQEQSVENLKIRFQRFRDDQERIRIRVVDFSPEHQDFLDSIDSLSPDGYLEGFQYQNLMPFLRNIIKSDHAIKFPARNGGYNGNKR